MPSDGKNRKTSLENSLYSQCQFCTPDQRDEMSAMWKQVAQTSACSRFASFGGTSFSWPCSATSCTATIKGVADKMPSCIVDKENERTRILNSITACTRMSVATSAPSPASTSSSGVGATQPSTTRSPIDATPAPPRVPMPNSPDGNNSPVSANDSSTTCSPAEIDTMLALFVGTVRGSNCKSYGTVSTYGVRITAPFTSSCVTMDITALAEALPDCYYTYEARNKKTAVTKEPANCKPISGHHERALLGDATEQLLSLQIDSKDVIKDAMTPSSSTPRPPAVSSVPAWKSTVWLVSALFGLTALLA